MQVVFFLENGNVAVESMDQQCSNADVVNVTHTHRRKIMAFPPTSGSFAELQPWYGLQESKTYVQVWFDSVDNMQGFCRDAQCHGAFNVDVTFADAVIVVITVSGADYCRTRELIKNMHGVTEIEEIDSE